MKFKEKSWVQARTAQLVDDLNAVRAAILGQKKMTPAEQASLEPRLFESWVIEKLASAEAQAARLSQEMASLLLEVDEMSQELKALRKSLPRSPKKSH